MATGESSKEATKAPVETPSKMLRQLSRALVQPPLEQQLTPWMQKVSTPRKRRASTPHTPRTRQTPIIHLTPSSRRQSLRIQNKDNKSKTKKMQTPQDLLRVLSRAPGFVPEENYEEQNIDTEKAENSEIDEFTGENFLEHHDEQIIEFTEENFLKHRHQDEQTIEFTGENFLEHQDEQTIEFTGENLLEHHNEQTIEFTGENVLEHNDEQTIEFTGENVLEHHDEFTGENFLEHHDEQTIEFTGENYLEHHDEDYLEHHDEDYLEHYDEGFSETENFLEISDNEDENSNILNVQNKEPSKPKGPPQLPKSLIKKVFSSFTNTKLSKTAMQAVFEGTQLFFEQIATDLATYAAHGKRENIQDKDVLLLMKRQGVINDKISFEHLAERYLPRELSDEVCLAARAGNKLYPNKK